MAPNSCIDRRWEDSWRPPAHVSCLELPRLRSCENTCSSCSLVTEVVLALSPTTGYAPTIVLMCAFFRSELTRFSLQYRRRERRCPKFKFRHVSGGMSNSPPEGVESALCVYLSSLLFA